MNKIAVIILNYNGWQDTLECVESILNQDYQEYKIIIIDNNSENDSYDKIISWLNGELVVYSEYLKKEYSSVKRKHVELSTEEALTYKNVEISSSRRGVNTKDEIVFIKNSDNLGFSGGNNVGAKYAYNNEFDYTLLLNNDTIIIDSCFLKKLVSPFNSIKYTYLTGPNIINFDGTFDSPMIEDTFCGNLFYLSILNRFRKLLKCPPIYIDIKAISSPIPIPVYKVSGACMMFDTKKLKDIDYLDEGVWLSSEEAIISEKIKKKGGEVVFQSITTLIHKKAQSPRPKSDRYNILKNHYKQRDYFYREHRSYGTLKMKIIKLMTVIRLTLEKLR
jgi:GT2 family glycosyltransferase